MNKTKKRPEFWWDFEGNNVIVESNSSAYPLVAIYPIIGEFADREVEMAETLIEELNSERKDYIELAKLIPRSLTKKYFPNFK